MSTTPGDRSPIRRSTSTAPPISGDDAARNGAEAGSRESSVDFVDSTLALVAPSARDSEAQPMEHEDGTDSSAGPAHSWLPRDGEQTIFASGWAADDATLESSNADADDPSAGPAVEPLSTVDSAGVTDPNAGDGHVEAPEDAVDYLADRDVLEFALWQRGCRFRRSMLGLSRRQCSLMDPCEDCGEHDGAYVPPAFWENVPRNTLEDRLHEYRFSRTTMPVWRPSRMANLHVPRVRFSPAPDPPSPGWLQRETTPDPPIFRTPPPPPHDDLGDRD